MPNIGSRRVSPNIKGLISFKRLKAKVTTITCLDLLLHHTVRIRHFLDARIHIFTRQRGGLLRLLYGLLSIELEVLPSRWLSLEVIALLKLFQYGIVDADSLILLLP